MENLDQPGSLGTPLPRTACKVCANLRSMFTDGSWGQARGPLDSILQTECEGHGPLFEFLRAELRQHLKLSYGIDELAGENMDDSCADSSQKGREGDSVGPEEKGEYGEWQQSSGNKRDLDYRSRWWELYFGPCAGERDGASRAGISIRNPTTAPSLHRELLLAVSHDDPETPGRGRILDPHWVDLGLARRWKRDCLSQHQHKCSNPLRITAVSPAWVIDTVKNCIVPGTSISEYVALSYRWGVSAGFRSTTHILGALQEPGALSPGSRLGDSMAPILQHSMGLTRAIDERYLWVDAVCVVQDDEAHLVAQLGLMGAIYATAKLTIVASDGDAMEGILGLKGLSPPRNVKQTVIPIYDNERVISTRHQRSQSGDSPYFERGWTYQEFYLSQRRLTFSGSQIRWHCSCANWEEDLILPLDAQNGPWDYTYALSHIDGAIGALARQPDFEALNLLVSEYNGRDLSLPEDASPAISGLLSILGRSFEGGFLYGLPETVFDSALMWRSNYGAWIMERRQASGKKHMLTAASRLPSWSWVSWKGNWLSVLQEETFNGLYARNSWTFPITQWFTHKSPECDDKRPIHSDWYVLRERCMGSSCDLPEGWAREVYDEEVHGNIAGSIGIPEGLGPYVYRHATIPDQFYWLPIPIITLDREIELISAAQTPYISCDTRRGWFAAARFPIGKFTDDERSEDCHLFQAVLLDDDGKNCGRLYLQDPDDILGFPEAASEQTCLIEIVAICRRREPRHRENSWRLDREVTDFESFKDVYGVLWVEWIDGIAYRRASGRIDKDAWEAHALEDIHLVLG